MDEGQAKYHCDLIAKNGNDVYRYPSPLHAVAVQSPIYFQSLANQLKDDASLSKPCDASGEVGQKLEQPLVPQSTSWPATSAPPSKKLDSYIFGLLQRRAQPMRTNKPRTSINTDPSKSILRQASLCVRQAATGQSPGWSAEVKPNWQATLQSGGTLSTDANVASPQKQWSTEAKSELSETAVMSVMSQAPVSQAQNGYIITQDINSNSLLKKKTSTSGKGHPLTPSLSKDSEDTSSPNAVLSPKHAKHLYSPAMEDRKSAAQAVKTATPKKASSKTASMAPTVSATVSVCLKDDRSTLERVSLGSSSQSQDEGNQMVSAQYIPAQKQAVKLRKGGGKNVKIVKVKSTTTTTSKSRSHVEQTADVAAAAVSAIVTGPHRERHRSGSKKPRHSEDLHYVHAHRSSKKASSSSSRAKRIPASIPEGRILDKHVVSTHRSVSSRHHGHHGHHGHREPVVVAKPKHKRNDYRRLRAIAEVPYDEAFRRAHRRQKRELLNQMGNMYHVPSNAPFTSPYAYVGSDSEYSAECASLFHSTILDTSEDERSNYTTNCFGDSESSHSEAEYVDESTTTSDSEESGSGGGGGGASNWPQFSHGASGAVHPQEMTAAQAKAFVKIKASHNLKKRILRFRSGSLKLMTTV